MPSFRYKAMTASGTVLTGVLEAPSQEAAVQELRSLGHYPIHAADVATERWRAWATRDLLQRRRIRPHELAMATHELSMLLHAGLALDRALDILVGMGETQRLRQPLANTLARVRDGASLADALASDKIFPRFYVSMVRAGEMSGNLDVTLRRLADYLGKSAAIQDAVISALVYPTLLLVTAGFSIGVILVFVLPRFEPLFASAGKTLPLATRLVMAIGSFLAGYWWALGIAIVAVVAILRWALGHPEFRRQWDSMLLRLPIFGGLIVKIEVERFGRTLGTLLGSGVALPAALGITQNTLGNTVIAAAVGEAAVRLREGEGLAQRLARARVFPAMALDLVRVGEETGKLDEMLLRQADLSESSVKHTVERLLALLVPALTVLIGFIVAGIIASLVTAILSVNDLALQ